MILESTHEADSAALDDADFERLDRLLLELDDDEAMVVEELDGYLAAMACVPDAVGEADCIATIVGDDVPREDFAADAMRGNGRADTHDASTPAHDGVDARRESIARLVRRHARQVVESLDAGRFSPVLGYDEHGQVDGAAWAVGFLRGVETHPESWAALLDEKDFRDALDAVETLAATLDDEGAARRPSRAEREALVERMIDDVADIHEFFAPYRHSGTTPQQMRVETFRRTQPKPGRNEPCSCGSGRKYKNCCGKA